VAEIVYGFRRMGREDRVAHFEQVRLAGYDLAIDNWKAT